MGASNGIKSIEFFKERWGAEVRPVAEASGPMAADERGGGGCRTSFRASRLVG
jgi:hypothetical protein